MTGGVLGESESSGGFGVMGWAQSESGPTYGIFGLNDSSEGTGVFGAHQSSTGTTAGVHGVTISEDAQAVGVYGEAKGPGNPTNASIGVKGESTSEAGTGVRGVASAEQGTTYGVYGSATSEDGYGGYFEGRGHFSDEVGIGTTEPTHALHVKGVQDVIRIEGNEMLGSGGRLSFGDDEFVYIEEDTDDRLSIYSRLGTTVTGNTSSYPALTVTQSTSGPIIHGIDDGGSTVFEVRNSGRVVTTALEITGGGDLVEGFETGDEPCEPGMVLIIDPDHPGRLIPSSSAYDTKVAGVVSGAGGVQHGVRMGQDGVLDGDTLVAMTGRVYVHCTTEDGSIRPGDLLTTSSLSGHAMRATDPERSFGSVIGKAMTSLEDESGLVLVLVNLQ